MWESWIELTNFGQARIHLSCPHIHTTWLDCTRLLCIPQLTHSPIGHTYLSSTFKDHVASDPEVSIELLNDFWVLLSVVVPDIDQGKYIVSIWTKTVEKCTNVSLIANLKALRNCSNQHIHLSHWFGLLKSNCSGIATGIGFAILWSQCCHHVVVDDT